MSAFVIGTDTMDRCVKALSSLDASPALQRLISDGDPELELPTRLGRLLYAMNVDAVTQRYPDVIEKPEDMPGVEGASRLPRTYVFTGQWAIKSRKEEWIDGVKALHSLQYQCFEGDVPESDRYKALADCVFIICEKIVKLIPAYEKAPWD